MKIRTVQQFLKGKWHQVEKAASLHDNGMAPDLVAVITSLVSFPVSELKWKRVNITLFSRS